MIKIIFLTLLLSVQLSCGGEESGSGSTFSGDRGSRQSVNLSSFRGYIYKSNFFSQEQFQYAVAAFMSAAINPISENLGVVSGSPVSTSSGIVFSGRLNYNDCDDSNRCDMYSGSSINLVVADEDINRAGVFTSTFRHYIPNNLPSQDRPFLNVFSNSCVDNFKAYFEDSFGGIVIAGETFNRGGERWVRGQVSYENDSCYCDNNFCAQNYCDLWSNSDGIAYGFLGDFQIPYNQLFSRSCGN